MDRMEQEFFQFTNLSTVCSLLYIIIILVIILIVMLIIIYKTSQDYRPCRISQFLDFGKQFNGWSELGISTGITVLLVLDYIFFQYLYVLISFQLFFFSFLRHFWRDRWNVFIVWHIFRTYHSRFDSHLFCMIYQFFYYFL